jgi:DNA repair protein RecO (recombination protein O)
MARETTLAYVIRTQDYRDTSLLATFFTRDFGKVKAILKGGRDARNKWGSTLEPFSLNEILIYRKSRGDLHLVTAAELVDPYYPLRSNLERLGTATYLMELIDQMLDQEPHDDIFELVGEAFGFMAQGHSPKRAARFFEMKFMRALGLLPEISRCIRCGATQFDELYFSISSGGIVCGKCKSSEGPLVIVSKGTVQFLDQALKKSFAQLASVKATKEVGEKAEQVLRQFLDQHLAYAPKSLKFLEKIGNV